LRGIVWRGRLKEPELPLRLRRRPADRWPSAARQLVALERRENLARALDDRRGQPGEPRDLDAVAAIRSSRNDLAQKDDVVLPLARGDVKVDDARRRVGEVRELVIVRGEERLRAHGGMGREALRDGPRDAQPIEGRRPASDLVEDD